MDAFFKAAAGLAAIGCCLAAAAPAAAGQTSFADARAASRAEAEFGRLIDTATRQSAAALAAPADAPAATGRTLYFDPASRDRSLAGEAGYNRMDAAWAKSNLKINDVLSLLGGDGGTRRQYYRRLGDRYYVGLEGMGGRWFDSAAAAQGFLLRLLLLESADVPLEVKQAVSTDSGSDLDAVVARARGAIQQSRTVVVKGSSNLVTMRSNRFTTSDGVPNLRAPEGIQLSDIARRGSDTVVAKVAAAGGPDGTASISAFAANSSFQILDSFPIFVVSGSRSGDTGDDHGAALGPLLATNAGVLERPSDNDTFKLSLSMRGRLTIATSGPTDTVVTLRDEAGQVLGADDDSGPWYNASLSRQVGPGTYFVQVEHCCLGTGSYTLTRNFRPN